LHSILNFKEFFKNSEKNNLQNIYQSKDSKIQLNQLNDKLGKLKIPNNTKINSNDEITNNINNNKEKKNLKGNNDLEEECFVKIKDTPIKNCIVKVKTLGNNIAKSNKEIVFSTQKKSNIEREYYYFNNEGNLKCKEYKNNILNSNRDKENKKTDTNLIQVNNSINNSSKPLENFLDKSEKNNIIKEIHFNSDVRMKRYEILLEFINSNMKEIEKMVSGGENENQNKVNDIDNTDKKLQNQETPSKEDKTNNNYNLEGNYKINYSKIDEINKDAINTNNINYISYVNSLKKLKKLIRIRFLPYIQK